MTWDKLQTFVKSSSNSDLIKVREHFNRNSKINFIDESGITPFNKEEYNLLSYNSFGICDQVYLKTNSESGLTRVQASFKSMGNVI